MPRVKVMSRLESRRTTLFKAPAAAAGRWKTLKFSPVSVAADNVEDDGSGRYAEQLLDHAGPCSGCCSCQRANTCFPSVFLDVSI